MFQPAAVMVKAGLVQLPCDWVGPRSICAGAATAVVDVVVEEASVEPPAATVVELPGATVVELPAPAPAVVVELDPADPPGGGGV
jgi:hypothetical protein